MKIREGFVSNSSSSSFIIRNKDNWDKAKEILDHEGDDYLIFKDMLITSFIYDCRVEWGDLYDLIDNEDDDIGGDDNYPYGGEEYYLEVEGEKGLESVWIPREYLTDEDYLKYGKVPMGIAQQLYRYVKSGINSDDKNAFYDECQKIVNYESDFEYEE